MEKEIIELLEQSEERLEREISNLLNIKNSVNKDILCDAIEGVELAIENLRQEIANLK